MIFPISLEIMVFLTWASVSHTSTNATLVKIPAGQAGLLFQIGVRPLSADIVLMVVVLNILVTATLYRSSSVL